jgi:asparagine synthase (glutamine-hydrolysing)
VTVALSGDGGDELFAGYLRFLAAEAAERIPAPLRAGLQTLGELLPGGLPHHSLGARARRFLVAAKDGLADRSLRWNSVFAFDLDGLVRPELRLDLAAPLAWMQRHFEGEGTPLQRILDHNFRTYLAWDLQTKLDRCSAGAALEVRSPFLDTALVEYAGRLPDGYKRRGTTTKRILRAAFADLVPEPILKRGKMGFGVPLATWFRGELASFVRETLAPGALLYEYLHPGPVGRLIDEHAAARADHSPKIWTLLTLETWLRSLRAARAAPAGKEPREARVHG